MTFDPNQKLTRENFNELPPLCLDGAWGTEMAKLGAEAGEIADVWNTEHPEKVLQVAKAYVDAGADVILTNTFNSNRTVLQRHDMADRVGELCKAGSEISKQAAGGKAYVFASIGPCGKLVMMGELLPEEQEAYAAEQAGAHEAGGADAIVIETQTDLMEAEAGLKGALRATSLPVGVTFTFDAGENQDHTMMGVSIADAYKMAKQNGASFVGANCGVGIETFVRIAEEFAKCGGDLPIWVKGNAGLPQTDADGNIYYCAGPDVYAQAVPKLLQAGARFIGGCCGSSPDHIRAISEVIRQHR